MLRNAIHAAGSLKKILTDGTAITRRGKLKIEAGRHTGGEAPWQVPLISGG